MSKTALLIVDAQVNMFDEEMPIYRADEVLDNLVALCEKARNADTPIIFVRHNGEKGDVDEPGTAGWQLHRKLPARQSDLYVDKGAASAFENTRLQENLMRLKCNQLVIAGMQTEVCIKATTREAVEVGYDVTIVSDTHSTFDDEEKTAKEIIAEHNTLFSEIASLKSMAGISFQ